MGVPALFRWLSKKYPRIVSAVEEEQPRKVPRQDGADEEEELPIDMSGPNPNGEEFDCLYLDMNGIVHPCTHPEGKPAPETEEDMMLEVFAYTERVVNMVRPRRLLMMAIDGVAPRAKMNQQRSRRFRAAQEAKEKEEEKVKAMEEWKSRGLPLNDDAVEQKKSWDSNAITPGTPFMDLLASSLRYWVAKKLNTDPGWKNLQVIISDASVPGEGEHKIMDFIRRQRSHPEHDANTKHVIYGLDADLIMLSLATHEPYFKVLREDVFAQEQKTRKCHKCGREGHIAANCIGEAKPKQGEHDDVGAKPPDKKPFIFLDVVALREYLEVELNVPGLPFKFDLERAIDDWVFLIFFVGNDFLPHLPSLEIREGAIDSLLRIWKKELPRMGTWLTCLGKVEMKNAQIILEGIAQQEDDIFRRRKEQEERQESNTKRRKIEDEERQRREMAEEEAFKFGEHEMVQAAQPNAEEKQTAAYRAQAIAALESGKNEDIVANQRAIRMANLSAAEKLKAELKGKAAREGKAEEKPILAVDGEAETAMAAPVASEKDGEGLHEAEAASEAKEGLDIKDEVANKDEEQPDSMDQTTAVEHRGIKRSLDESEAPDTDDKNDADPQEAVDPVASTNVERKVNADGTVEVEDTVKLWEPGYRERYYQQKFGIGLDDKKSRRAIVKSYMEGMSWVLAYYYQGCPSWTWYYPYHFSPFAADFTDLDTIEIEFDQGKPFRPYDQLMGVLPAASRKSIPPTFHSLMTDEESEIIDFYPETFSIDMNGKKMAWQGVALLPFIDETRLLAAINARYHQLSEDEVRRNAFGNDTLMVADENKLYDDICAIYATTKAKEDSNAVEERDLVPVNPVHSGGINGFVLRDPNCVPNSTFNSPLTSVGLMDLHSDRSISVLYEFPAQKSPHRSVLLKGVKKPERVLTHEDREFVRRGPQGGRGRGGGGRGGRFSSGGYGHHSMHMDEQNRRNGLYGHGRNNGGGAHIRFGDGPVGANGGGPPQQMPPQHQWNSSQHPHANGAGPYGGPNAYSNGGGSYGAGNPYAQGPPPAGPYGQYGGYGQSGGGYGAAQPPSAYAGYGGYGNASAPAPVHAGAGAGGYGNGGGYGGYGGQGGGYSGYGGGPANAYGQYGGYGASGGQAAAPAPPLQAYGPGSGYSGVQQQQTPRRYGGGAPPRPMGFRDGGHGGGGNGHRGGRGGGRGGGPYGQY